MSDKSDLGSGASIRKDEVPAVGEAPSAPDKRSAATGESSPDPNFTIRHLEHRLSVKSKKLREAKRVGRRQTEALVAQIRKLEAELTECRRDNGA